VVEERSFFEYHLYEIGFPVNVNNQEAKQIQWLPPTPIQTQQHYVFEGGGTTFSNLPIKILFTNDSETGTGVALPGGIVRLFQQDTDGSLELIGEDNLKHTSRDDLVTLEVGEAFDVKGKREVLARRSKPNRYQEEDIQITLANRKDEQVTVDVIQYIGQQNWSINTPSQPYQQLDASRVKFAVVVPGQAETVLSYTTHTRLR